tara:strand:+ start:8050 stop:8250 length:201 start_codon:yes stop_codon:yes gene_type:complete
MREPRFEYQKKVVERLERTKQEIEELQYIQKWHCPPKEKEKLIINRELLNLRSLVLTLQWRIKQWQ